ncbi:WD40 repeat-like protein [Mycena kentingensis (nom. inval.)]|nr:WD40 repeat-like protein [Mycena kentingensis (nom. inval.)]
MDLAPVSKLPNELVSEILLHCIPQYPTCPPLLKDLDGACSPTKLAQICSLWRRIAHATPGLWRAIPLFEYSPNHKPEDDEWEVVAAETWLTRSGTLPLSIVFGSADETGTHMRALEMLLLHRRRWEYVVLRVPAAAGSRALIEGDMPFMREFDMPGYRNALGPVVGELNAPLLRTALLFPPEDRFENAFEHMPWAQLTRLRLRDVSVLKVATVLRQTGPLVDCRLEISDEYEEDEPPEGARDPEVRLPKLETLVVYEDGNATSFTIPPCLPTFFKTFRLPALRQLCLAEDLFEGASEQRAAVIAGGGHGLSVREALGAVVAGVLQL